MGESSSHIRLVDALVRWVAVNCFAGDAGHILIDSPKSSASAKPPRLNGFVPDVYANDGKRVQLVIGEAKTACDLENAHTRGQLSAFVMRCAQADESLFVLAVPWHTERFARSLVRKIQNQVDASNVRVIVLGKLKG